MAYWPFDGNYEETASGMKTELGAKQLTYTEGVFGKAAVFNGKDTYLYVKDTILNLGNGRDENNDNFTVSFWLKATNEGEFPVLYRQNPSYADDNDNDWTYRLYVYTWGVGENISVTMNTRVYNPDDWSFEEGPGLGKEISYADNKIRNTDWVHYSYTYQNGQLKCYINGVLQNKSDVSDLINIANASGDLLIGYDGDTFLNGAIDELKIYTSCESADDIKEEAGRVDSISISSVDAKNIASIAKGKSVVLNSVLLKDGNTRKSSALKTTDNNISYKTSNKKVFTVSSNGKITGVKKEKQNLR